MHLINNLDREGAQVMVSNLVAAVRHNSVECIVCARRPGGALATTMREHGISVYEPPSYYGFRNYRQFLKYLLDIVEKNRIDVIHAHMADSAFIGWLLARRLQLPLIITHHGDDILMKCNTICRKVYYLLLIIAAHHARMNIAVSNSVSNQVRRKLFLGKPHIQVISNSVQVPDISTIQHKISNQGTRTTHLTLVNVGRLVPLKGQRLLIDALAKIIDNIPDLKLYIVGEGSMRSELEQLAVSLGVDGKIEFTGNTDDVSKYLADSDVYVSTSYSEGMPVAVLEAMAWHIPVIASDIPGNRNVITDDETGFLYETGNIAALVKAVLKIVEKPQLAASVSARARALVESRYSMQTAAQAHEALYMQIAKTRKLQSQIQ